MISEATIRAVRLLDIEASLGADFDPDAFRAIREQVICPLVEIETGAWSPVDLAAHPSVRGRLLGAIVVSGLSVCEVLLAGRVCTHLYGPGDFIAYDELAPASLPIELRHHVPITAEVALLDDRFLAAARRWPRLAGRLMEMAAQQIRRASTHQAISQLPRVEDRLVALFWHLADRWGHVGPDGIRIDLTLTHEALGRLIGARRPTVSLGLRALADDGRLIRAADGVWRLDPSSIGALACDAEQIALGRNVLAAVVPRRAAGNGTPPMAVVGADRAALMQRVELLRADLQERQEHTAAVLARNAALRARSRARREAIAGRSAAA